MVSAPVDSLAAGNARIARAAFSGLIALAQRQP